MSSSAEAEVAETIALAMHEDPVEFESGIERAAVLPEAEPDLESQPKQRRPRRAKTLAPTGPVDFVRLAADDHLAVLRAALAGLEQVDLIMSMAARMIGVAQAGTALTGMRETKRRLAALIEEVTAPKPETMA